MITGVDCRHIGKIRARKCELAGSETIRGFLLTSSDNSERSGAFLEIDDGGWHKTEQEY
jgi:hypothetical protein